MLGRAFLLVCIVTLLGPKYSNASLKEQNFDSRAALQDVLAQIQSTDVPAELFAQVFPNADETVSTLSNLLTSGQKPNISVILDIFNLNFGRRLLIENGEYLQVDPWAVQGLISERVMPLVKSFRSNPLVRQMAVEGVFQRQIQRAVEESTPLIEAKKMPLERMTALISLDGSGVAKRDLVSDLLFTVVNSLCTNVVSLAYSYVNTTLIDVVAFLESISVGGDNNLIGSVITLGVNVAVEIVEGVNEILSTFASTICSSINGSTTRKRRDVSAFDRLNRVALNELATRDVALGTIIVELWEYIWNAITGAIEAVVSTIWNLLFGWLQ